MPKLFLTPSLAIRSRPQNVRGGALAKQLDLPWDVNLHVLYQATKFLDVYVTVRNAFDHHYALGGITSHTIMLGAENLFQQARLLTGELSQRWQAYQRLTLEQQENLLQGFSFSMAPAQSAMFSPPTNCEKTVFFTSPWMGRRSQRAPSTTGFPNRTSQGYFKIPNRSWLRRKSASDMLWKARAVLLKSMVLSCRQRYI
jgi:hypothetical protein